MNALLITVISFFSTLLLILIMMPLSGKMKLIDRPDSSLKNHKKPVPQTGGLVLYVIILGVYVYSCIRLEPIMEWELFAAMSAIFVLGLIDDYRRLSPIPKLIVQTLITVFAISRGYVIEISIFPLYANMLITYIWIMGIMNAFNLMDIMDGLAGGIGLIISLTLLFINITAFYWAPVMLLGIIIGFLCAFLVFNKPSARVYLGDSGSLLMGFALAVLSIMTRYTSVNHIAYLTPLLIFGIPIFDTTYVTIARMLKGLNPIHGSADHFVMNLRRIVKRKGFIVFIMMTIQASLCLLAFISTMVSLLWALIIYVFSFTVLIRIGFYIHGICNEE